MVGLQAMCGGAVVVCACAYACLCGGGSHRYLSCCCVAVVPLQVLVDALDGLRFCHEGCGGAFGGEILLHRDLKPENILLRRDPSSDEIVAALGDFGISKLLPETAPGGHVTTRTLIGTLG